MRRNPDEIAKMRKAGRVVAEMHQRIRERIRPGVTTRDLDRVGREVIERRRARSNFLGYHGFPAVICTSPNDVIVHGIPGKYRLQEGDIISIDCGAIVEGWHGDAARTFYVGDGPPESVRTFIETTRLAMMAGIAAARAGNTVGDIGAAVEDIAIPHGYGVVRQYVGHGIGRRMHEEPQVPNYRTGFAGRRLEAGMCLAIEPMFTIGDAETTVRPDEWTVVTRDGSLAAHFEHTIAITDKGWEILTTV